MNKVNTQNDDEKKQSDVELSGILKIPAAILNIEKSCFYNELNSKTQERNLKSLDKSKHHITLIHQSFLKALSKLIKKKKAELILPAFPNLLVFNGKNNGEEIRMVMDVHPKTNEMRQTLRLVLCSKDQQTLQQYVAEFCELNNVNIDEFEQNRIFHISYSNLTGLPGDSVR